MPTVEEMRQQLKASQQQSLSVEQMREQLKAAQAGSLPDSSIPVTQETHPEITFGDRFVIKNFGVDPDSAAKFLKSRHSDMVFTKIGDQLAMRKPDDKQWHVLDPEGFDLEDITDVGYDVGAGVLSGAATAAAGLGAGAATGGAGAIPAAMAAGGASSAGLEYLRQKIGQGLGVAGPEVSKADVALAGGAGALAPFLLGTGATAGKIAAKAGQEAVGQRLLGTIGQGTMGSLLPAEKKIATELLTESQRGIVKNIPGIFGAFSGIGKQTIEDASKEAPAAVKAALGMSGQKLNMLAAADMLKAKGLDDVVIQQADQIKTKMFGAKQALQQEFSDALSSVGGIDPQKHYTVFEDLLKKLESSELPEAKREASKLKDTLDGMFFQTKEVEVPADVSPEIAALDALFGTTTPGKGTQKKLVKEAIQSLSGEDAMRLKQYLKDLSSTFTTMEGKPVHSKEVMQAANEAMTSLSDDIDQAINAAGGDKLMGRYRDFSQMEREVMPLFEDPNKLFTFLRTADNKTKAFKSQVISKIDKKYNLGIRDSVDQMNVLSVFGDPSWNPLSAKGSTSTSATLSAGMVGGGLGQAIGGVLGGPVGGRAGHAAGYVGGSKLASPGAAKLGIKFKNLLADIGMDTPKGRATVGDFLRRMGAVPQKTTAFDVYANMNRDNNE